MSRDHAIQIVRSGDYISVSTTYPPRPGEDWSRGNDIVDGKPVDVWASLAAMATYLASNPEKTPEDWKQAKLQ